MRNSIGETKRTVCIFAGILIPVVLYVCIRLIFRISGGEWLSDDTSRTELFFETCILFYMSIALSLNLRSGSFDFSLGALAAFSAYSAAVMARGGAMWIMLAIFFGVILGIVSGGARILSGMTSAVSSLCFCLIFEGLLFVISCGQQVNVFLPMGKLFDNAPLFCLHATGALMLFYIFLRNTPFGYDYRAICASRRIACASGVDFATNKFIVYIVAGALMGVAGVMLCVKEGRSILPGLNFSSVRILFFALLPLFLGRLISRLTGELIGAFLGALCSAMIYSAMTQAGLSENFQVISVSAALLLLLIYMSNERKIFNKIQIKKLT
ncbi:MAG: hypothetical protein E7667_05250 [Ruminococcaceae bacterium]|nr:hypothetical protein [Oscillospiraceae bacterium]